MAEQVVVPRMRGFIATSAHPAGCAQMVAAQIARARRDAEGWTGGKALILGSSAGYGLATRIVAAFRYGMDTLGVFYERPAKGERTASAGWYNTRAFTEAARADGLKAVNINGDAFSTEVLQQALATLKAEFGPIDLVVHSLAAPQRTDPVTGITHRSVLKAIGQSVQEKTVDLYTGEVVIADVPVATEEEIEGTVAVMGGADLERWVDALLEAGLLARNAKVMAYSYIGPHVTWPYYHHGTIGRAKADLEATCKRLDARLAREIEGHCYVSVNKSIVTQAASAIPIVPLYVSVAYGVMKEQGVHEEAIDQMIRLFEDHVGPGAEPTFDAQGRIRLDDREMHEDIQQVVTARWPRIDTDHLDTLTDWAGCQLAFRQLFGFDVPGVDYDAPVEIDLPLP